MKCGGFSAEKLFCVRPTLRHFIIAEQPLRGYDQLMRVKVFGAREGSGEGSQWVLQRVLLTFHDVYYVKLFVRFSGD